MKMSQFLNIQPEDYKDFTHKNKKGQYLSAKQHRELISKYREDYNKFQKNLEKHINKNKAHQRRLEQQKREKQLKKKEYLKQ